MSPSPFADVHNDKLICPHVVEIPSREWLIGHSLVIPRSHLPTAKVADEVLLRDPSGTASRHIVTALSPGVATLSR